MRSSSPGRPVILAVGRAQALLGEILIDAGQPLQAVEVLEAAIDAFPETGGDEVRAGLLANLSRALMRSGEPARAIQAADLAVDLAEHLGLERIVAETFNNKGSSLGFLGRKREGLALLQAAVEIARAGGFVAAEIRALTNLAGNLDDHRRARDTNRMAEELARRVGNRSLAMWTGEAVRIGSYFLADGWDEALAEGPPTTARARATAPGTRWTRSGGSASRHSSSWREASRPTPPWPVSRFSRRRSRTRPASPASASCARIAPSTPATSAWPAIRR